jgi:zinc-ribbon domain
MEENMNKVLKWILGILAVLLVLAVIAGVAFLVVGHWGGARGVIGARSFPFFDDGRDGRRFVMPMGRNGWFPMMRFGGFFPLGMIFGGLFWTLVIFLCVVGVISLFRGRKSVRQEAVSTAPVVSAPVEAPSQTPAQTCSNCGRAVQKDWSNCPYCGNKLE